MVTFWIWLVRNPAVLVAAVGVAAGASGVAEWALAMPVAVAGVVVADAGHHLARSARRRGERRAARIAAQSTSAEPARHFTDYNRAERDAA